MDFKEFVCEVERKMNMELDNSIMVKSYTSVRNNGKERTGILLEELDTNVSPAIYLEEFYLRFQKGETLDEIVRNIIEFYHSIRIAKSVDPKDFLSFGKMENKIVFKVIHTERNQELLREVPHLDYLDLSIVFYLLLEAAEHGTATILITNEHMQQWDMYPEKLFKIALRNCRRILPAELCSLQDIIRELLNHLREQREEDNDEFMYILSNSIRSQGAACILYPHIAEMIGDIVGEDYYILPSSVHEVIIVPKSKGMPIKAMNEMIQDINEAHLDPEEILSDHAYYYERKTKKISMKM